MMNEVMPLNKKTSKTAIKIQQAATKLFAEKGYDGTIMDELAELIAVNKASIYYHFQSKENLYDFCLHDLFATVADAVIAQVESQTGVEDKLWAFVQTFAKQTQTHSQMPSILMREIASGGIHMPIAARQQMQRLLEALRTILLEGEKQGIFAKVDPLTTHFMIIGSLCFFITSKPMRDAIGSEQPLDPTLDEATNEIYRLINNAVKIH
ncbi:TetR/AcrR family transcriptional regulator [Hydrogenovibrio kuenenii]|uniref:TetR/AcrR family transcriptional regulator n=1 Tax=Hydrogenovibrio kuenenii TaxID=63658 RepID=UPI000466DEA3|nr:TetR/AcrR family transcriptional regulator [Hydrogenovibrio kuenenii]